ncbi:tetratricopeptide repeat protein [Bradyrhizobium sp. CCGUVB1N3]|uniref:tetratricopeptide repeat protein n=1 Tax=Bradyrhizobium sp. CCGUVB1N3 TaxID=2949629 RepID=UPI0020B31E39|nr:tetratricopeptide repeat protein [Bradyrhizobium sp. CCGUVB1N3]MCP3472041.1 tetratricopeptide repeat protein [Bradyrhizobium sp. CCGUVB1N3]
MTRLTAPLLIVSGILVGLSLHTVVNCGDANEPDVCSAVIGFSPFRGPLIAFAYEGRGRIALRHGDAKRAIADFDQAIHLNPNRAATFRDRAQAYRQHGELDLAVADYDQAIALDPKLATSYSERGLALAAKGDLDRAILSYNTAIRLAPNDVDARVNRGVALLTRGRTEEARADFEAVLALPERPDGAAHQLARAKLTELGEPRPTHISAPLR